MLSHNRASNVLATFALSALLSGFVATLSANLLEDRGDADSGHEGLGKAGRAQLGPRPFFLVNDMEPSSLKSKLKHCAKPTVNSTSRTFP